MNMMIMDNTKAEPWNLSDDLLEVAQIHHRLSNGSATDADTDSYRLLFLATNIGGEETLGGWECSSDDDSFSLFIEAMEPAAIAGCIVQGPETVEFVDDCAFGRGYTSLEEMLLDEVPKTVERVKKLLPKKAVEHEKQEARDAFKKTSAELLETNAPYDHERVPNKYAHVREKDRKRVGKDLQYPSVPNQSQYGFHSLHVRLYAQKHIVPKSGMTVYAQAVFNYMLTFCNQHGFCSVGVDQLTEACGLKRGSTKNGLKWLQENGVIDKVFQGNGFVEKTNNYRVTLACDAILESEELLAKRWYVLTGKTDMDRRWEKLQEIKQARSE